jgi:hypothetical protein
MRAIPEPQRSAVAPRAAPLKHRAIQAIQLYCDRFCHILMSPSHHVFPNVPTLLPSSTGWALGRPPRRRRAHEVRHAIAYVLLNARRHAAKAGRPLAALAGIDSASSGRWFGGWRTPVAAARDAPAVAGARSWLLAVG